MSSYPKFITSRLSLQANISWYFVGNVVYTGCQWGMLVVLAKLGSTEMIGQFSLGLAITAPAMMFASSRMRLIQATDAKREYLFGDYLGLRLLTTTLALLVIVGIMLITGYSWETRLVILAVGFAKTFEMISDVFYGLLQRQERMDRIAKSLMIKGSLSLMALSIGVYLTGSVFWGTMGLVVIWALVLFNYDVRSGALILRSMPQLGDANPDLNNPKVALRPRWEIRRLAKLEWLILPLGFVVLLDSVSVNIPRYFVDRYLGTSMLGIFAALASFDRVGNLVVQALMRSASPRLSQYYVAKNNVAYRTLLLRMAGIAVLLGGVGVLITLLCGDEILTLCYGPEYARQDLFVLMMVAAGFSYVTKSLSHGLTAARYIRVQLFLSPIITATMALLCILLIPHDGLQGGAKAFMIARFVELAGTVVFTVIMLLALQREAS